MSRRVRKRPRVVDISDIHWVHPNQMYFRGPLRPPLAPEPPKPRLRHISTLIRAILRASEARDEILDLEQSA